jgi:hypothetical protein
VSIAGRRHAEILLVNPFSPNTHRELTHSDGHPTQDEESPVGQVKDEKIDEPSCQGTHTGEEKEI